MQFEENINSVENVKCEVCRQCLILIYEANHLL